MAQRLSVAQGACWARQTIVVTLALLTIVSNLRLYSSADTPADLDTVGSHLHYLRGELDQDLGADMQALFPEGYFFSYALYGLTWVNVAERLEQGSPSHREALAEARWALEAIDSPEGRAPFSPTLTPEYGGFYVGWTNYLRAGIVRAQSEPDPGEVSALLDACDEITTALEETDGPFLASYPGQVWPVDTYPAMVSVAACEQQDPGSYPSVVAGWLDEVDQTVDQNFGLVGHRTEPYVEHPRATSQTLIVRFLAELDQERAAATYEKFRATFVTSRFGIPAVREHPIGVDAGGDVDSGPLVLSVSASASVVAIATAQANDDPELAAALRQTGQSAGWPLPLPSGTRYALGVLPLGDLFVIWAASSTRWFAETDAATVEVADRVPFWWRWPTHLLATLVVVAAWAGVWPGSRRRASRSWSLVRSARSNTSFPRSGR